MTSTAQKPMAELESEFGGKLRLALPNPFNGDPASWEEWAWNFRTYLSMFEPSVTPILERSETSADPILDDHFDGITTDAAAGQRLVTFSRKLHYLLANLTKDSARLLVRQNEGGNGFETWRRLHRQFSLPDATRHVSLLTQLLDWKFNTSTFEQDFNAWETVKAKYERQTGTPIPDSVLVATLMNKTQGALQQHLRLNAHALQSYQATREVLVQYFRSRHILTTSQSNGAAPMDIGALKGKGKYSYFNKGKGKKGNKGKGKGGFGHWNFMKGKAKGLKGKGKPNFKGKGKQNTSQYSTSSASASGKGSMTCWSCGTQGHTSQFCPWKRVSAVDET